ncbi:MAG: PKD domain-containing protein, partial [Chloroflexi bacterium]|nr:PKD domain-containing protein [Chloroflexota bacterium]
PHAYQVAAQPVTATQPIGYLWDPEPDQGQYTEIATYTLTTLGEHALTVYANNPIDPVVTATRTIVSAPPLTGVTLDGPITGYINAALAFTATVAPIDAATPIDYTWSPAPVTGQGTDRATYHWAQAGTHVISLTAHNDSGTFITQQSIEITGAYVYLPLVRK